MNIPVFQHLIQAEKARSAVARLEQPPAFFPGVPAYSADFLKLREQLYEIDIRFEQIGEKGIFSILDRQGIFQHHVNGINDETIAFAQDNPPRGSRAHIRGECVKRFSANSDRYRCYWTHIHDLQTNRILNLFDPFEANERWEDSLQTDEPFVYD